MNFNDKLSDIFLIEDSSVVGFTPEKTGMSMYDEILLQPQLKDYFRNQKNMDFKIEYMSPREYLSRTKEGFLKTGAPGDFIPDEESVKKYAEMMKNGTLFNMPTLDYMRGRFNQEGRHRAMAAEMIGIEKIPVFVVNHHI